MDYLKKRGYGFYRVNTDRVDYAEIMRHLAKTYHAKKILTDTGRILNCILLNNNLVDEISLPVHPVIVGK